MRDKGVTEESELIKAEQYEEMQRMKYLSSLRSVLGTHEGCFFLRKLMQSCFVFDTTLDRSNAVFAANEGRRTVLLELQKDMAELVVRRMMAPEELVPFVVNIEEERDNE